MSEFWSTLTPLAILNFLAVCIAIPMVLYTKKGSTSPIAWCLVILLVPLIGSLLFWIFGYTYLHRPLKRMRRHRLASRSRRRVEEAKSLLEPPWTPVSRIAWKLDDSLPLNGNSITFLEKTPQAFQAICDAVSHARHHVHIEFYIIRGDDCGRQLITLLEQKAREGIEVRILFDSLGAFFFGRRVTKALTRAGGEVAPFLPLNIFNSRLRVNLRNHRKLVVIDGTTAFTGGMNIGDEYLGRSKLGYWRDQMLQVQGPVVEGLQRVFIEDWDFTTNKKLRGPEYFPPTGTPGSSVVQVLASGPDQETNVMRSAHFAAISTAKERLWMASPYFIPDGGMMDAIHWACARGVDVRLLMPLHGDHRPTAMASRYYWMDLLHYGVQIYLYHRGMMHAKYLAVDGQFGIVGSANLDPRSLSLNFEIGCALYDPALVHDLEQTFLDDMRNSTRLNPEVFARRSFGSRLAENACRLFSPVL